MLLGGIISGFFIGLGSGTGLGFPFFEYLSLAFGRLFLLAVNIGRKLFYSYSYSYFYFYFIFTRRYYDFAGLGRRIKSYFL